MLDSSTKELDERFKGLDASVRGPIMKDMQAENELLRHYVEKCRLEKWFEGTLDLAKQDVAEEVNEESENSRATEQEAKNLKQMEDQIAKAEQQHALEMLRSKPRYKARTKLHGSIGLGRSSVKH
jgi:nuclear pore complex protein Nup133